MTKCDNCVKDALYVLSDPGANPVFFCAVCLPSWLRDRASLGQLDLPKEDVVKSTKSFKKKAVAEDGPADESN